MNSLLHLKSKSTKAKLIEWEIVIYCRKAEYIYQISSMKTLIYSWNALQIDSIIKMVPEDVQCEWYAIKENMSNSYYL